MDIKNWLRDATKLLASSSPSPRVDAQFLLTHVINKNQAFLYAHPEFEITESQIHLLNDLLEKRSQGMPIAYLTHHQDFYDLTLFVNEHVLIPRPETELLVEIALSFLQHRTQPSVLDLGTGSGALAFAIAKHCPKATVLAVDNCRNALSVANKNQQNLALSQVELKLSNWFENIEGQFDLIVSNPPYIDINDEALEANVKAYEPIDALISEDNGLNAIATITKQAANYLKANGMLLLEHGHEQQQAVSQLLDSLGFKTISYYKDLNEKARAVSGIKSK